MVRTGLRRDIGARLFDQWLRQLALGDFCAPTGTLELTAPSDFAANFVASNYGARLSLAWRSQNAGVSAVRVVRRVGAARTLALTPSAGQAGAESGTRTQSDEGMAAAPSLAPATTAAIPADGFRPRHDFAAFVADESNRLAFSASQGLAAVTQPMFNPLFIHGGTGQGKTHLLHAIAGAFLEHSPNQSVLYMSAERFMVEFVGAIRANDTMAFKARLRAARLLLIDDIQFIAGKGPTQEEFLHTINDLIDSGARIAIAADRAPQAIEGVDKRILSRLAGGLVADIQPAGLELRLAILRARRASTGTTAVGDEVIDLLARSIRSNIRELEGAFNKLIAYSQLMGRAVTIEMAQTVLADSLRANARRITIDEIQRACAAHYRIDTSEMRSARRARAVARPRQVAMYLAKKLTPRSLPEIGRIFGGRDHSTVIHAVRTIEALRKENADIDQDIRTLQSQLEG
ncbi:chromosomal replication initiator protein DnaA [Sphingobium sufflavum]|uniref:chromosomal replication initiator protein DnaA n=1 Tax=Sphingobium sufflavum TaxID=1129547 RepID=UPI001F22799A|nr:chromosomal replication initiator protein DnaA [Sphingobium sufflavum]MCE7795743.1 chromosomal replication initiator protein DnaA [Sphingobium sufflavum]